MQKSFLQWKSSNPLLFICLGFLLGNSIGSKLNDNSYLKFLTASIFWGILLLILLTLILGIQKNLNVYILSIISWLAILITGILLQKQIGYVYNDALPLVEKQISILRLTLLSKLRFAIGNTAAYDYSKALLFGIKNTMDKETMDAYKKLGLIHIIAISGMHLDIITHYFKWFTSWWPHRKFYILLELLILLSGIWIFTLIAFSSPSIIRASISFTLYTIGRYYKLPQYTLNSILFGTILFMLFDKEKLSGISLQLSYAAVLGIHFLYPTIKNTIQMQNPILTILWNNLSLTLAAQITTFPVLVFHFHQISSLVLLSNFIMIPLSNLLLYALLVLLIYPSALAGICTVGYFITHYINTINQWVVFICQIFPQNLPNWNMNKLDVGAYYVILLLLYLWITLKYSRLLIYALGTGILYFWIKLFSIG